MGGVVVAAVGSELRGDDGAGPAVVARVVELLSRGTGAEGTDRAVELAVVADPLDLVGRWDDADLAVVVDAMRSGAPPGTLAVVELEGDSSLAPTSASTHTLGLARALRLARAIGQAPARVVVVGIEGTDFGVGADLSPAVVRAVPAAASRVVGLLEEAGLCRISRLMEAGPCA